MEFKEEYKYIKPAEYINIFSNPQWYLAIQSELKEFFYDYDGNKENKTKKWLEKRREFAKMICELLKANKIALGNYGIDWDKERLPIDTIVIHHTSTPSNIPTNSH